MSSLSPEQVKIIKSTVLVLRDHGKEITSRFYEEMLAEIPNLNSGLAIYTGKFEWDCKLRRHLVFNQTNQLNGHQAAALADSLYAYATHIDNLGVLSPALERISQKHVSLYVQPEQYEIVGKYLLQSMKRVLGDALTPDIHDAWAVAYLQLANLMINREAQLLEDAVPWRTWREFRIIRKVPESSEITSFHLAPLDGKPLPSYLPGQYISIRMNVPGIHYLQARQYSLSDAPHPDYYRITIKKEKALNSGNPNAKAHPGYISNILHDEKNVGDFVEVSHPAGEFFLDTRQEDSSNVPIVLISAGVGLTPDLSILNTLTAKQSQRRISWVHASRNSGVQAFGDHIKKIACTHDNVQTHVFLKEPGENDVKGVDYDFVGRMSLNKLDAKRDLFIHDLSAQYYICGPVKFMTDMAGYLEWQGIGHERIKTEVFGTGEILKS